MTFEERIEALTARHEALTARHEAFTMNVKLMGKEIEALIIASRQDGENIRALVRIAEIPERRLSDLEE